MLLRVLSEEEEGDDAGHRNPGVAPGTTRPSCIALTFGLSEPKTTGGRTRYAGWWMLLAEGMRCY